MNLVTISFIGATFVLWIAFDIWIGLTRGASATISEVVYNFSKKYPIFPFIVGIIMGHLFWTQQTLKTTHVTIKNSTMEISNAKEYPRIFYGLHFVEGVAEYKDPDNGEPYRIFVGDDTIREMGPTFAGKPVYVRHVEQVNLENLQAEADGYVEESFFNPADGKHWAKFIVVSDAGQEAIRKGWKLSNAYLPRSFAGGGKWHNVEYTKEVKQAEYTHLALVPDPRYDESIILTPDQFKDYNSKKNSELKALANSKEKPSMFNFFKKTKAEVDAETVVTLKNGREITIAQLINEAEAHVIPKTGDEVGEEKNAEKAEPAKEAPAEEKVEKAEAPKVEKAPLANGEHMVKVGEEEMTVNALVEKYMNMYHAQPAVAVENKNEEKETHAEEKEEKKKEGEQHFNALKNAMENVKLSDVIETSQEQLARGRARYGSGN